MSKELADTIVAIVGFSFALILLPQVIDSIKGHRSTNPITAAFMFIGISVVVVIFFMINMPLIAISNISFGIMWLILFICSIIDMRKLGDST